MLTTYEIPWGTNEMRTAQVTMVIAHDLIQPPPAEGSATITVLCQIVG